MKMCFSALFKHLGLVSNLALSLKHPVMIHTDSNKGKKGCHTDAKAYPPTHMFPEASTNSRNKRRKTV